MPKTLADGHRKLTILIAEPADKFAPTEDELNDGIDASCQILDSDFVFGATGSDTVQERALCESANSTVFGADNYQASMTFFRYFLTGTGLAETAEETAYQAAKEKGTILWCYLREDGNTYDEDWAANQVATFVEVLTDNPQVPSAATGYIKRTVPMGAQTGRPEVTVAAGA